MQTNKCTNCKYTKNNLQYACKNIIKLHTYGKKVTLSIADEKYFTKNRTLF